jgi:hypothetical protein
MSRRELSEVMRGGSAIDPERLVGWAYRGVSLGLPAFVERLSWKTFAKTFVRRADGSVGGYNVRVVQAPLTFPAEPPEPQRTKAGAPVTFGPYGVERFDPARHRAPCTEGLVLDYSKGEGARGVMSLMRDPITAVSPGDAELLLGWMYADIGLKVPTPSFFTLERVARVDEWLA